LDWGTARRKAATAHRTAQTQNKRRQTSTPQVGFQSTILVFERAKTVHALDRAANVVDKKDNYAEKISKKVSTKKKLHANCSTQTCDVWPTQELQAPEAILRTRH
jgi:hypothetical protein